MTQTPHFDSLPTQPLEAQRSHQTSFQQTALEPDLGVIAASDAVAIPSKNPLIRKCTRIVPIIIILALGIAIFYIWHAPASTNTLPGITRNQPESPVS